MKFEKLNKEIQRVVIIGGKGFVGSEIIINLSQKKIPFLSISRQDVDLLDKSAMPKLKSLLNENDAVIIASAIAPVKNNKMLTDNIIMMDNICNVFLQKSVQKILYVSSDAVYADKIYPLNETSITNPTSLHGIMHLTRELMLKEIKNIPLSIIRPTLIYGKNDPHNGYGPNSFNRLLSEKKNIVLFGKGEEKRDHIFVNDVAELCYRIIFKNFEGVLNAATGIEISFHSLADKLLDLYSGPSRIEYIKRRGEMPHHGLRTFDPLKTKKTFPDFKYTLLDEGLVDIKII